MLNKFTCHAAQDRCLIGYLHDVRQRFQTIYGARAHVKSNQKAAEIFSKLCDNSEERAQLKWVIENSTDNEASKIFAKYVPHLEFAGCQVSYGATFNSQLKSKVIESCKQYGPPSGFLTVSFNDLDNPRSIRACFQTSSNPSFPSGFDEDTGFGNSPTEFMHHM